MTHKNHKKTYFLLLSILILLTGCKTPQNVAYFQDISDTIVMEARDGEIKIKPNDRLGIVVKTMDPALSALFNLSTVSESVVDRSNNTASFKNPGNTAGTVGMSKYTVSPQGTIDFPVLGELKVAGMTRSELSGFIKGELMGRDLAKDPVVTVEFENMGVSILGEVKEPGRYQINQDKVNVIDAISMAGDLTIQGLRENVTVLREEGGQVKTYKLDLTNFSDLVKSPAYYLQQGDIVYIEPNSMRKRQTSENANNLYSTGFWISVASLLTSVVTTVGVFVIK